MSRAMAIHGPQAFSLSKRLKSMDWRCFRPGACAFVRQAAAGHDLRGATKCAVVSLVWCASVTVALALERFDGRFLPCPMAAPLRQNGLSVIRQCARLESGNKAELG